MPTKSEWVDPEVFFEHDGIVVYHIYKDDDFDAGIRTYWFTVDDHGSDDSAHGKGGVFDIRRLPEPPTGPKLSDHPEYIGVAEGDALGFKTYDDFKASNEYARRTAAWKVWHESGEAEAAKNTIRHAIDTGVLTEDGVKTDDE